MPIDSHFLSLKHNDALGSIYIMLWGGFCFNERESILKIKKTENLKLSTCVFFSLRYFKTKYQSRKGIHLVLS